MLRHEIRYNPDNFDYQEVCVMKVETKVKDLTVKELKALIAEAVKESLDDLMEDILALSSENYLRSIEEARKDYKEGKVKSLEEIADV